MKHSKTWAKRKMMVYLLLFLALCLFSLVSARLALHDAELVDLLAAKHPPDAEYPMGTDGLGRCILSRILAGAYSSIFASLLIVVLSMFIGCTIGMVSGYAGGIADEILMRVVDIFLAFPGIVLSIAVAGMLGPGLKNGIFALAATGWTHDTQLCAFHPAGKLCQGGNLKWPEQWVYFAAACISQCHPASRCDRNAAFEQCYAEYFRTELSRTRLLHRGVGQHAFGRTQSDAAVSVDCFVSGACDFSGHDSV